MASTSTHMQTKASVAPDIVQIPERRALVIEGTGAPEGGEFERSIQAIYGITYTMKFERRHAGNGDIPIGPLEGDWWVQGAGGNASVDRARWRWRLRMTVPDDVTDSEVQNAIAKATTRKNGKLFDSAEAGRVSLKRLPRSRCGRILHVGPYATEPESFAKLEALLAEHGLRREPWHTEVYLSDPRRTNPENLKTVLLVEVDG